MNIRAYNSSDYQMLKGWWEKAKEVAPSEDMIPNSTFILETDEPILSISVLFTNAQGMCFLENFIANPDKKENRKEYSQVIVNYALNFAKEIGYKRAICFSYKDKLKQRYRDLGMTPTVNNLTSFVKEL